jgi:hypothetical protein
MGSKVLIRHKIMYVLDFKRKGQINADFKDAEKLYLKNGIRRLYREETLAKIISFLVKVVKQQK